MSTPEITKASLAKLSPLGGGINKSLLTPCRRLGLSRKRKSSTPNSIVMVSSEGVNTSDTRFIETSNTTPLNHKNSIPEQKNLNCDNSVLNIGTVKMCSNVGETLCKKKLVKSFPADLSNEGSPKMNTVKVIKVKALVHSPSEEVLASEIIDSGEKENILDIVEQPDLIQINSLKAENYQLNAKIELTEERLKCDKKYNSDEEFMIEIDDYHKCKNSKDFKSKSEHSDKEIYVVSDHSIKECKVTLKKLSCEEIDLNVNKTEKACDIVGKSYVDKRGSEESIVKQRKRNFISIDDDDFFSSSPISNVKIKKETKLKKRKSTAIQKKNSLNLLNDDDDDNAFTSTPEKESNEKKDLIHKIKNMEYQVKEKTKKLEDLKQAAVYKKKHNVEELKALTETWRSGCISGLKGLLNQLQAHGPMDMPTLLSKLNISNDAYYKLFSDIKNN